MFCISQVICRIERILLLL
uniref:Uncharacterized protein n=1 Tax=Arundo donax TaxID=35708 RepID=A0A0A9AFI8_ARUDO